MPDPLLPIAVLLLLLVVIAFLNTSEIALINFSKTRLSDKDISKYRDKKKNSVISLYKKSSFIIYATSSAINLMSFIASSITTICFAPSLAELLNFSCSYFISIIISCLILILPVSYVFLIFGEMLPRKLALKNPDEFVIKHSVLLNFTYDFLKPLSYLCIKSTNLFLRLLDHSSPTVNPVEPEDEILMMLDKGNKKGTITEDTRHMIQGIFDFDDTAVSDIMTHRIDMSCIEDIAKLSDAVNLAIKTGFSRLPIFHEDFDNIVGVVYVKDLLKYVCCDVPKTFKLTDIMREAIFVPRSKLCNELFSEMKSTKTQIAIIIDEYGGTEGLVTIENLVEEIFGNIQDEYDNEEEEVQKLNDNVFTVDGSTSIDELSELMETSIPDGDYDTISGLIIEKLGYIPKSGEYPSIVINGIKFTVSQVDNRRISKVLCIKK